MSLSSLQLDAFLAVARTGRFSLAAKSLNVTQSALSQRVLNLEQELGSTLFIRQPGGISLTELGERLLRYCRARDVLESEFTSSLGSKAGTKISGHLRVGGFSTISGSVLVPAIAKAVRQNPDIQIDLRSAELRDLPGLLASGQVDLIFVNQPPIKQGVESHHVGFEECVLVHSARGPVREDVFLDHDVEDTTTEDFFRIQKRKPAEMRRSYFDDINTIIEAAKEGLGFAVVPLHLVRGAKGLKVVEKYQPLRLPVYLTHYSQAFYTRLHRYAVSHLLSEVSQRLKS
jgi:DNA-binding transcriptional LysR family regulator